jgi:uncharacterized phage protein gp47/JayE
MYSDKTYENIKKNILDNINVSIDKREGSFTNNIVSPMALELAKTYLDMEDVINMAFIRNGCYNYLDVKCEEYGISRKTGVKATGEVLVNANIGTVIPINTKLYTDDSTILYFTTVEEVEITSIPQVIKIEALEVGKEYNLLANTELSLQEQIQGVESIAIKDDINSGEDIETDDELRNRYFDTIKKSYTSGNVAHYELWTTEVNGVGGCKVYPLKNGNGTVEIVIVDSDMLGADEELIERVKEHIEENRPVGANVSVVSATEKNIDISAKIVLANGYSIEQVQEEYTKKLTEYLKEISFKTSYVSIARLGNLLLDTDGVFDYSDFKVNNSTVNISLSDIEVPKVGTVIMEV